MRHLNWLRRQLTALHWIVIGLSLLLTVAAWQVSARIADARARDQFVHQIEQINALLVDRMRKYEFALIAGVGTIKAADNDVTYREWQKFSQALALPKRLPGIHGIGLIDRVSPDEIDQYTRAEQQERPYFKVHPVLSRKDYWPIRFIEPEPKNLAAVGLNIAHESNRYQAALKAMRTGETTITGPIILVQDAKQLPGFLFFHPFYKSTEIPPKEQRETSFLGLVYAPFTMANLMEGTLANSNRLVHFRVTDGESQLYSELDGDLSDNYAPSPMFTSSYTLDVYGRTWAFDVQTTQLFETFNASRLPIIVLLGGLIISALILGVFVILSNGKLRAERQVERKTLQLRDSLGFINTVTDNLPVVVSVWSSDLKCRFMNAFGRQWFPNVGEHTQDQPMEEFVGHERVERRRHLFQTVIEGDTQTELARLRGSSGTDREISASYYPITLDGQPCFMATMIDITDLTLRENQLKTLNKELEAQKQEAESATRVKSAFLANMSHEIRTPMNAIIGMLVLLQEVELDDHARGLARKAFSASEALLQLLNDILDLSKIEGDHVELDCHSFDIDSLVHRSVDLFAIVAEEKGLHLQVAVHPDTPQHITGDLLRIAQICTNLVGNAIKFTKKGRITVQISFREVDQTHGVLMIEVQDTGVGIRQEDKEKIFENFRQADESTSRNFGGTGLGLAISQRLALLMKASLTVESVEHEGTTFHLDIPVEIAAHEPTVGAMQLPQVVRVFHHGLRYNRLMLDEYRDHWSLETEELFTLDDLRARLLASADVLNGPRERFIIEIESVNPEAFNSFITDILFGHSGYPTEFIILIVPAGMMPGWLSEFQRKGGRVISEPLTPSKLYEELSHGALKAPSFRTTASRPGFKNLQVLLVDDVPVNCEIVESYLAFYGVRSKSASTGDQALNLLRWQRFDLVLMDLHLDGETGQEVAARIRAETGIKQPLIAALSASISENDRSSAQASGMEAYLTKPVLPGDIEQLLMAHFSAEVVNSEVESLMEPPSSSATQALPNFISLEQYDALFSRDPALFDRCVRSFLASVGDTIKELEQCLENRDEQHAREVAHKIKGAAANIADVSLQLLAGRVEQFGLTSSGGDSLEALLMMLKEHASTLSTMDIVSQAQPEPRTMSAESLDIILKRIETSLSGNRLADDKDIVAVIQFLISENRTSTASQFRFALDAYDFELAIQIIERIAKG